MKQFFILNVSQHSWGLWTAKRFCLKNKLLIIPKLSCFPVSFANIESQEPQRQHRSACFLNIHFMNYIAWNYYLDQPITYFCHHEIFDMFLQQQKHLPYSLALPIWTKQKLILSASSACSILQDMYVYIYNKTGTIFSLYSL